MDYSEVVATAALSAMFEKIFSHAIDNFLRPSSAVVRDAHRRRLELLVGIIDTAVEEAKGRDITKNLRLLDQLQVLKDAKYRGHFALESAQLDDVLKNAPIIGDDDAVTTAGKRKFALCWPFNAVKRARGTSLISVAGNCATTEKALDAVVEDLELLKNTCLDLFIQLVQGRPLMRPMRR